MDPDWLRLQEAAAGFPSGRPVTGPRPAVRALRDQGVRALLLVAANSRALPHSRLRSSGGPTITYAVTAAAEKALGEAVETGVLPGVSHHGLPPAAPSDLGRRLIGFLG